MLLSRGVQKGDKVAILLMNCLEWLPIYFGILKTGALAVPLNFRYSAEEIEYCLNLAEVDVLVFGPEFIGRVEEIADRIGQHRLLFYVGDGCPSFAKEGHARPQLFQPAGCWSALTIPTMPLSTFLPALPAFPKPSSTTMKA